MEEKSPLTINDEGIGLSILRYTHGDVTQKVCTWDDEAQETNVFSFPIALPFVHRNATMYCWPCKWEMMICMRHWPWENI